MGQGYRRCHSLACDVVARQLPLPELRPLYEAVYASNLTVFYEWRLMALTKFLVFLGSARDSTPPRPARLGHRVARQCQIHLEGMGHAVELIDPLSIELPAIFKAHFELLRDPPCFGTPRAGEAETQACDLYL